MEKTILQAYLNNQFIKTDDEKNITNLQKAAGAIATALKKKKQKIVSYTLVAIDPLIAEDDPVIIEVEKIIISKWKTFRNRVANTNDKATTYIRAVILEALRKLANENQNLAAIIWLTSRNIISHYKTGSEGKTLETFLLEIGGEVESEARIVWASGKEPEMNEFIGPRIEIDQAKAQKVSKAGLEAELKAATVYSGWSTHAGGGENPQTQAHNSYQWPKFFAERAAEGISKEINTAIGTQHQSLNIVTASLQSELDKYFGKLKPFFEQVSSSLVNGLVTNNKRSELLWWKQTLYSLGLDRTYRSLSLTGAAITMATDLAELVDPIYPHSVDFLLREALKEVHGDQVDAELHLTAFCEHVREVSQEEKKAILLRADGEPGRKPLLIALANLLDGSETNDVFSQTGIDSKAKLTPADFAVWLFHDLQAEKLTAVK